jgi:hypothetical protein
MRFNTNASGISDQRMMFYLLERDHLRKIAMESQPDRDRIAEEAVGQRHESARPYAGTKPDMSQEEAARKFAAASGAEASAPEKTAESIGERIGCVFRR